MKCPKCNRSICECPEQPEGYELRRFDDLGGEPAPSPTQGERPAEARHNLVRWTCGCFGNASEPFCPMHGNPASPQDGATAVGADELVKGLRKLSREPAALEWEWIHDACIGMNNAAALIEALQRQVARLQDPQGNDHNAAWRSLWDRCEAAESSLRTLGDALERAREALAEHDLTNDGCKRCGEESYQKCGAWTIDHAPECVFAVLTPPTRDTSCEAVAKQEPATKWDVRKSPCPTCGHHIRTVERVPFQYDDEPAAPSSPSDKDT